MNLCSDCTRKSCLFKSLTDEELRLIDNNKETFTYEKGDIIIAQGDTTSNVMSFTSGSAKIFIEGVNNKKLILSFLKPTEFFGSQGIYANDMHYYSVEALETSTACSINKDIFKHLINTNHAFSEEFIKYICEKDASTFQRYISLTQKQMPGRIADSFLYLYNCNIKWAKRDVMDSSHQEIISISKRDIADLSNIARDNVTRLIKQFETDGIINVKDDMIELIDIPKLQELSRFG